MPHGQQLSEVAVADVSVAASVTIAGRQSDGGGRAGEQDSGTARCPAENGSLKSDTADTNFGNYCGSLAPTAKCNCEGMEAIIDTALNWERRSGATFEAEKTAIIHFTESGYKSDSEAFIIKGQFLQSQ